MSASKASFNIHSSISHSFQRVSLCVSNSLFGKLNPKEVSQLEGMVAIACTACTIVNSYLLSTASVALCILFLWLCIFFQIFKVASLISADISVA